MDNKEHQSYCIECGQHCPNWEDLCFSCSVELGVTEDDEYPPVAEQEF